MEKIKDGISWRAEWRIDRFSDPDDLISGALKAGMSIEEAITLHGDAHLGHDVFEGNVALNEGLQELIDIICGIGTPTKWDSTNARIGVGNDNSGESATQTGLQGASKTFKAMDGTYPQKSAQTAEWRSTFGSSEGNHAWEEFTVVNAADDAGKNLNRKVADKGTKSSGESWTASVKITFS